MAGEPKRDRMSLGAFLDFFETRHGEKWELIDGIPVMMTNPRRRHGTISGNVFARLLPLARGRGCEIFAGDMKVRRPGDDLFAAIPDITICCGPRGDDGDIIIDDQTIIIELTSPSSKKIDVAHKLQAYTEVPALEAYIIIHPDERRVEVWRRRRPGGDAVHPFREWVDAVFSRPEAAVPFPELGAEMTVADTYADTDLADQAMGQR